MSFLFSQKIGRLPFYLIHMAAALQPQLVAWHWAGLGEFLKFHNFGYISEKQKMAAKPARRVVEDDLTNVEFETSEDVEVIPTFDSMGLREDLLR